SVQFDPDGRYMLLMRRPGYPGIKDLAAEMLRLGGIRIDPATNGRSRPHYYITLEFRDLDTNISRSITGLPDPFRFTSVSWSPDGKGFALTELKQDGLYLWYVDVTELKARQLLTQPLNGLLGSSVVWLPDGSGMMVKLIPLKRGARPELPKVPVGPVIQENTGSEAAVRTYQDLLKNPFDVSLFDYFVQSELYLVKPDGSATLLGPKAAYMGIDPSPDGNYLLMNRMTKPYSYLVPYYYFPHTTEIWDTNGNRITTLFRQPLMENIPTGYDATIPGPRSVQWRNDMPATLVWVQALDGGNGKKQVPFRDQIYTLKAPFSGSPVTWFKTRLRYSGITWGRQDFALVTEQSSKTRQQITRIFDPSKETPVPEVLWDLSSEDRYHNPGRFVTQTNEQGRQVLLFDKRGRNLFLVGQGASPQGNQPFLDKFNVKTHATTRLWQSGAPYYESVIKILDTRKIVLITRRESVTEPVNYYIRVPDAGTLTPLTHFANPYPFMAGVTRQIIKYDRDDGVHLSATLYLPAGWKPSDGPLPTLLWAYPREYKSKSAAGQISGSPYSFSRVSPTSAIPFVTQGYAIIDGAAFPIIGEGDEEPNDHFVEQLVANAKAAIDKAVAMGVTDPKRVAVGGHSYGAFMTANLLVHSDLFAAGIARSGAYNRTLTPFGFQSERRTYWEAPDLYYDMSPFMHADQMKHPLLMIHGIADNNSGTFPIQSERFYAALKGHGATVRLVMLPLESHGYMARESLLHMLWEMNRWMEQYLKY
ncbi:MAG: S9 family peptidase, partial [Bacteroidales bacterium]|nr:S9 family peptidase [Bacteroidales bacterium]